MPDDIERSNESLPVSTELLPCPTCWLPADLVPPPPHENFPHARCPRGHDNTLIPAVLDYLREMNETAFFQSA